jgi:ribosomal protein L37AE/L43A
MTTSKIWKCPLCKESIKAIATQVAHQCPSNKNQTTQWVSSEEN